MKASTMLLAVLAEEARAGFLTGVWHGGLCVFRLLGKLFTDVDVWADQNSGIGYALGFLGGAFCGIPIGVFVLIGVVGLVVDSIMPKKYVLVSTRTYGVSMEPGAPRPKSSDPEEAK